MAQPSAGTPDGTTRDCLQYYIVQVGDTCDKVDTAYDITLSELQFWNSALKADCSNLVLGEAYCVDGTQQPPLNDNSPKVRMARSAEMDALAVESKAKNVFEGGVPEGYPLLKAARLLSGAGIVKGEL